MRRCARIWLLVLLTGSLVAVSASAAQASVEIEKFVGINCIEGKETCGEKPAETSPGVQGHTFLGQPLTETSEPTRTQSEAEGYRQAAGHVPYGVTDFMLEHTGSYAKGEAVPTGIVTHVRVDVATGLASSPAAVPQCTMAEFGETEAAPGSGFYPAPKCKEEGAGPHKIGPGSTIIGEEQATVYIAAVGKDVVLKGKLYNLVPPTATSTSPARSALYGAALEIPPPLAGGAEGLVAHTLVEGNVEWGMEAKGTNAGDYHDYFEVKVSPNLPLIRSRQLDYGRAGNGAFITNATSCPGDNTTFVTLEGVDGKGTEKEVTERLAASGREVKRRPYTTLLGLNECGLVPFEPLFKLTPSTTQSDTPDGVTTELTIPHFPEKEVDSAQLRTASVKLPEGMTLNPSAAAGLTTCTAAQARIHSSTPGTSCPSSSQIGTVAIEVPTLPPGSLKGNVYLGAESEPITKPPYTIYVDAESERYGVSVRLKGEVTPNEVTGQLTTTFSENPEQPFSDFILHFKEGALAPIANPLVCGTAKTETALAPFTGTATKNPISEFTVDSNGSKGSCSSPLPLSPTQGQSALPLKAGASTAYTFNLERTDGQQYLSKVQTVLPPGLIGLIPKVQQCSEAQAISASCPAGSQIGTATVSSGAGPTPYQFVGQVFFTGPYHGAPYGLEVVVPTAAGPFNLGPAITRATVNVEPYSGRVIVTSELPPIVYGGIPTRVKRIGITVNRPGYLVNPTNCGVLATETLVTGNLGATANVSSPFQVEGCSALAFKPAFGAAATGRTSKADGASLETTLNVPAGSANIKSAVVTLPIQLPSRLTTLQKACAQATFAANPFACPKESKVGSARANTPALANKLVGPAYLVSHAGEAFPDLDLVLEANGVRVILVGHTKITKGITTTNFATTPDAPVTSITVNLPTGPFSALAANGNLCTTPLFMPTTVTAQNGVVFNQTTKIKVRECGVAIVGHKVIGNTAYLTVKTPAAGRISGSGSNVSTTYRHLGGASGATALKVALGRSAQGRRGPLRVRLRVGFLPKNRKTPISVAFVTVTFK